MDKEKLYKPANIIIINMIPGDPQGLPDEFLSKNIYYSIKWGNYG